jgi:hypothetical protein
MLPGICREEKFTHLLICGDFNFPEITWMGDVPALTRDPQGEAAKFLEAVNDSFLWQHVKLPTHHRQQQTANTLDLILTNEDKMVEQVSHEAPLGKSHHDCLLFNFRCYTEHRTKKEELFNYSKADYVKLRNIIANQDFEYLRHSPIEDAWNRLYSFLLASINECIPKIHPNTKFTKKEPWIKTEQLNKIQEKKQSHKAF